MSAIRINCPVQIAMHIVEIVGLVVCRIDSKHDLLHCALVCKTWYELGIRFLWESIDSMEGLFRLLGTLEAEKWSPSKICLSSPISANARATFNYHAKFIKKLRLDFTDSRLSLSVFDVVLDMLSRNELALPNLVALDIAHWDAIDLKHSLIFATTQVSVLNLTLLGDFPWGNCIPYLSCLGESLPNLTTLALNGHTLAALQRKRGHSLAVKRDDPGLQLLNSFECGLYTATDAIVQELSLLPRLSRIRFCLSNDPTSIQLQAEQVGERSQVYDFRPKLSLSAFPVLVELWLSINFQDASKFVQLSFAPQLQVLGIHSPDVESAIRMNALLISLSSKRTQLTTLHLSSSLQIGYTPMLSSAESQLVTYDVLSPLLNLHDLVHLRITYQQPICLSNTELITLMAQWPAMQTLELCSDPVAPRLPFIRPTLTRDVLPMMAERCPALRRLAIYMHTGLILTRVHAYCSLHHATKPTPVHDLSSHTSPLAREDIDSLIKYHTGLIPPFYHAYLSPHRATKPTPFSALQDISFGTSPLARDDIDSFVEYLLLVVPLTLECSVSVNRYSWLEKQGNIGTSTTEWNALYHQMRELGYPKPSKYRFFMQDV